MIKFYFHRLSLFHWNRLKFVPSDLDRVFVLLGRSILLLPPAMGHFSFTQIMLIFKILLLLDNILLMDFVLWFAKSILLNFHIYFLAKESDSRLLPTTERETRTVSWKFIRKKGWLFWTNCHFSWSKPKNRPGLSNLQQTSNGLETISRPLRKHCTMTEKWFFHDLTCSWTKF